MTDLSYYCKLILKNTFIPIVWLKKKTNCYNFKTKKGVKNQLRNSNAVFFPDAEQESKILFPPGGLKKTLNHYQSR